ncbi:MAG: glycosyltransferase [Paracoccaceae bacterium]
MQPEQKQYQLVAVVVTYNRLDQLQVTVQRLLQFDTVELDAVVVVDNASTDGTGDWLATFDDPRLFVHRHAENGGGLIRTGCWSWMMTRGPNRMPCAPFMICLGINGMRLPLPYISPAARSVR